MTGQTDLAALEALLDEQRPYLLAHFNDEHPDSVAIIARAHVADGSEVTAARLVGLTTTAVHVEAVGATPGTIEVPLPTPIGSIDQLWGRSIELLAEARRRLGITELTSFEAESAALSAIPTWVTTVLRAERVAPHYVLVTVGGGDLQRLETEGFDQYVYVLLPPPGRDELTIDSSFTWEAAADMAPEEQPVGAYYTIREWRPSVDGSVAELDFLVALHEVPEGETGGHVARWAPQAAPGDPVALWGPRQGDAPPDDTDWYLLVADDTGLPQVAVVLERLPRDAVGHAVVELDGSDERLPVDAPPGVQVHWLYRNGAAPGTTTLLVDAVRALEFPPGNVFAWGGAESKAMTAVRKYLRRERQIERQRVTMVGYWRHHLTAVDDLDLD